MKKVAIIGKDAYNFEVREQNTIVFTEENGQFFKNGVAMTERETIVELAKALNFAVRRTASVKF